MSVAVRELEPSQWSELREVRLHALEMARGFYGSCFEDEGTKTDQEWQEVIRGPARQVFGAFDDARLVGIAAASAWRDDPSGSTAILTMWFVFPEFRKQGVCRFLCEASLDWIRKHPQFRRVIVSHRESNEGSRRVIERLGFAKKGPKPHTWHDGATEDEIVYELPIAQEKK